MNKREAKSLKIIRIIHSRTQIESYAVVKKVRNMIGRSDDPNNLSSMK